jgi:hypothetical protein
MKLFLIMFGMKNWLENFINARSASIDEIVFRPIFFIPNVTSRSRIFHLIWRRHHYRWTAAFKPMVGAQGLWAGGDLYRATLAGTRGLSFSDRRTAPFCRLLRHTWGCGESILTRILTGAPYEVSSVSEATSDDLIYIHVHVDLAADALLYHICQWTLRQAVSSIFKHLE